MKNERKVISVSLTGEEVEIFEQIKKELQNDDLFIDITNSMVFRQMMWAYYHQYVKEE